jgi:hypothetical protein
MKYLFFFILFLLPLVSAVNLNSEVILNTSLSNTSVTFSGCTMSVTNLSINSTSVILYNATNPSYEFNITLILTDINTNFDCIDLINSTVDSDDEDELGGGGGAITASLVPSESDFDFLLNYFKEHPYYLFLIFLFIFLFTNIYHKLGKYKRRLKNEANNFPI